MREGDQLVLRGDHRFGRIEIDQALCGKRNDIDGDAGFVAEQLPGDDIGMVFEQRQQNAVASLEVRAAPALRDQVDRLGRAAGEDDLVLAPAHEVRDAPPRGFERQGHFG